jgi:hypothetical protein
LDFYFFCIIWNFNCPDLSGMLPALFHLGFYLSFYVWDSICPVVGYCILHTG